MTISIRQCSMCLLLNALACGDAAAPTAPTAAPPTAAQATIAGAAAAASTQSASPMHAQYAPGPLAPGYQRFEAEPVDVPSGTSTDWAQWVGGPLEQDYDVIDITGGQSVSGHHAILYATIEAQPSGFTRLWKDEDQTLTRIMGGVGGEGGANVDLPEGVVFRVKKGSYLLLQTHYLNTSDKLVVGRAHVDVKLGAVDPSHRVASIFANTTTAVTLPPRAQTVQDVHCDVKEDLKFIQFSNHMHYFGVSTYTEFTSPSGVTQMLKQDTTWAEDLALNPNLTHYPADAPLLVPAGSRLHTHCEWDNTSGAPVTFPAEMCVFFGFIFSEADITCNSNKWTTAAGSRASMAGSTPSAMPMAMAMANAGNAMPMPNAGAAAMTTATPGSDCSSQADQTIKNAPSFDQDAVDCSTPCAFDPDFAACVMPCFETTLGLSPACAACNSTVGACSSKHCRSNCLTGPNTPDCRSCVVTMCGTEANRCK